MRASAAPPLLAVRHYVKLSRDTRGNPNPRPIYSASLRATTDTTAVPALERSSSRLLCRGSRPRANSARIQLAMYRRNRRIYKTVFRRTSEDRISRFRLANHDGTRWFFTQRIRLVRELSFTSFYSTVYACIFRKH